MPKTSVRGKTSARKTVKPNSTAQAKSPRSIKRRKSRVIGELADKIEIGEPIVDLSNLSVVAPREAAPVDVRGHHTWVPVDGLATGIVSADGDNLEITVSAEVYQAKGSLWLRALVDGKVAEPSDVQFKTGNVEFDGVRSFTFVQAGVTGGQHLVEIQMLTGTPASIRDRVLTVHSGSPFQGNSRLAVVAAPSGPLINSSTQFVDVPGLSTPFTTEVSSTLAIQFSAEARAFSGRMLVRAVVDGSPVGEVIFIEAGDSKRGGTRTFTFVRASHPAGTSEVKIQWRGDGGKSALGDRTMSVSAGGQLSRSVVPTNPESWSAGTWTDLVPATTIETTESVSNLAISVSTEVLTNKGRVFVRTLVDGLPAAPTDITLIQGGPKWRATSHTFILKNVRRGRHRVRIQALVDEGTTAKFRRRSARVQWRRRRGSDFVQPYLGMSPHIRRLRLLVIGFDPIRPGHMRPSFEQIRNTFEGALVRVDDNPFGLMTAVDRGPNVRGWLMENSGGVATIGHVRYVGCHDNNWYVAPPERQGDWYWTNNAFDQMREDALKAADAEVDFNLHDKDRSNRLSYDELIVALVRPQNNVDGSVRPSSLVEDSFPVLEVPILELYLSSITTQFRANVGVSAHELSHHIFGAEHQESTCLGISAGVYSIMSGQWPKATHLDPFAKMKNGLVQPVAIDIDTLPPTTTLALSAVELRHQIILLHDAEHVAREYFLIENRFPGSVSNPNYDEPIGNGAVVVWQIFEDRDLCNTSARCQGDPQFIRRIAAIDSSSTFNLTWADGSSARLRISAPIAPAELAQIRLEKF